MSIGGIDHDTDQAEARPDRVAICVCTKDRPAMFQRCLQSLLYQRLPAASLEVHLVVVDNSADAKEHAAVAAHRGGPLPIHFVHEPTPGIPNARNAALNALEPLSPDWVAFIDDDEIAPLDWIARLHASAVNCGADVASGRLLQFATAEEAQSTAARWKPPASLGIARERQTCATSNVIFRASLVSGPAGLRFDEQMRHGGSDCEFFMRAQQHGARIFAVKDAPVFEEYPPERRTLAYECMRGFRVGTTTNYRYRKNYGRVESLVLLSQQVVAKTSSALTSTLVGLFAYPFARKVGRKKLRSGARNAATAFGVVGPALGITTGRYW